MGIKSAMGDLRELHQSVVQLFDDDRSAEKAASLQITRSAQRFTKNTKEVVDDKLSFSATLMRAGEVQAANRLLAEVEHEVREEEAALIETVNEVKVAQSMRRERMTRIRLARLLAVATLGSAVLTFSAAGMAVAGFFRDRAEAISRPSEETPVNLAGSVANNTGVAPGDHKRLRRLRIGDVDLLLTKSQFKAIKELTGGGDIDPDGLEELLNALPAPLADRIQEAISVAEAEIASTETEVTTVIAAVDKSAAKKKRAARRAAAQAAAEEEKKEAQADDEASPEPTPSGDEDEKKSSDEEEDPDSGSSEEEEGDAGPPLPIKP